MGGYGYKKVLFIIFPKNFLPPNIVGGLWWPGVLSSALLVHWLPVTLNLQGNPRGHKRTLWLCQKVPQALQRLCHPCAAEWR